MEAIGHGTREVLIRHRDGGLRAMDLTMTPMHAADGLFVALLHDITHHKQSEDALQRAAMLDPLTKIANRRHFDAFLEKEWQRAIRNAQPLSLVVLDVDHFKLYNDTLGHAAGDACLHKVARRCRRTRCAPPTWRRATAARNSCCCSPKPRSPPRRTWRSDPHHHRSAATAEPALADLAWLTVSSRRGDHRADPARRDRAVVRVRRPGHVCGQGGRPQPGRDRGDGNGVGGGADAGAMIQPVVPATAGKYLH
jgi:hypothetical protein